MNPRVIVALDYDRREDAEQFVSLVKPEDCLLKVGLQMFTKLGPDFVKSLTEKGFGVFLDLKFYDAPHYAKRIPAEAEEAYKRMAEDIIKGLTNKGWGDFATLDHVYVIGGGANLVATYLPRQEIVEVMDDPAFANAWGFYKGAEKK